MQKRKIILLFLIVLLLCVFASALLVKNIPLKETISTEGKTGSRMPICESINYDKQGNLRTAITYNCGADK